MNATDVKITKISEESSIGANGQMVRQVVITFTVGTHGPFTERLDRANFDPAAARQAVTDFATKLGMLPGVV
jgi:hypothetical protein